MDMPEVDPEHPTGAVSSRLRMLGWFYLAFGLAIMLAGVAILLLVLRESRGLRDLGGAPTAALILGNGSVCTWGGWSLLKGQRYKLCILVAGASLVCFPVGSVMGYATLQALLEPEAQAAFQAGHGTLRQTLSLAVAGAIAFMAMTFVTLTLDR